jgi:hypothetical protein
MKRPLPVTIIGWLFIVAGAIGFLYHLTEVDMQDPFTDDAVWTLVVRLIAVLGGILLLRGVNAGRWIVIAWMAYHVVLGYLHPPASLAMHALLLAVISLALFNARVNAYFR